MPQELLLTAAALFALLLAVLVLLIVLLHRQSRQTEAQRNGQSRLEQLQNEIADEQQLMQRDSTREVLGAMQQQEAHLRELMSWQGNTQRDSMSQLDSRMEQLRQSQLGALTQLRQENERQLSDMRRTVDQRLSESLDKRLSESFSQVSARLEAVYRGLGEMHSLAGGVDELKRVLTNVKTRGTWGEVQLGALMSQLLSPQQYGQNVQVVPGSGERVEFAIRLPGRDGSSTWLAVDSKFPQEAFLRLQNASAQSERAAAEEARRALVIALRTEAKRIASKYIAPPHTVDFAVMFLPVEGLYAEAAQAPGLMEAIQQEQRVVIAGPSTFAALLNALQMGFRTLAIEQRSGEVWQLLGEVKRDFGTFAGVLEKTQQKLQQASESLDSAWARTRSIQRRLGEVEEGREQLLSSPGETDGE